MFRMTGITRLASHVGAWSDGQQVLFPADTSQFLLPSANDHPRRTSRGDSDMSIVIAQTTSARVDSLKSIAAKVASHSSFVVAEILRGSPGHGLSESRKREDSHAACVHLSKLDDLDIFCDERHVSPRAIPAGAVHISDMRHAWRADIKGPFHVVNFYLPQSALDEVVGESGSRRVDELSCPINSVRTDPVFRNLTLALLPALDKPEQTSKLFTDYAARTVITHLAKTYGSLRVQAERRSGGLAPWQERRAKELLMANLSGNLYLRDLASACRLSTSYFSCAFKRSFGCPPHQWLLVQRVQHAKELILNTGQPLSEIALATGFADQSHFTRVFTQLAKSSPAAWRRTHSR